MKLLWLCNIAPGAVKEKIGGKRGDGLWTDHVLAALQNQRALTVRVLCPDPVIMSGEISRQCSFRTFARKLPYEYLTEQEALFRQELKEYQPDVIHIWGTEYAHTLAMIHAAEKEGFLDHTVVSIQGLCSIYAGHYSEGVPNSVVYGATFRDVVRRDNIPQQQKKFALRGDLEVKALRKARHVIGRTAWDKACTEQITPDAVYHFCNETLRKPFYQDEWSYDSCCKHRIFASSCVYPVKGFHYLLEAMAEVLKRYPDATIAVPGKDPFQQNPMRVSSYQKYLMTLMRRHGLENKVQFLGGLSAEEMKNAYLEANVFALPSTIENSPNSLGEAMLLGVPCVAADVGGVTTMMTHEKEGFVYQSTAPYMLAHYICKVFAMEEQAQDMGQAAKLHASVTHDPQKNLQDLLDIYTELA